MSETTTASTGTGETTAAPETGAAETTNQTTTTAPASETTTETKAADSATILGGETTEKPVTAPATWPTDWRQQLAGEDKKLLDRLGRFGSPADILKSYRALEQQVATGELKKVKAKPGEGAKPEELAEWRKENGVPDKPEDYKIELPQGVNLGEADKPLVESFTKSVHGKDWTGKQVNEALEWYYGEMDRQADLRAERDATFKSESEEELRGEWGAEYKSNLNAVKNLVAGMPEGMADNLLAGRLADGRKIGDSPAAIRWLANISRELNPAATLLPAGTGDVGKGVNDRIAEIEKLMGDKASDYWKGPKAEPMQAEYRDLIEAREKMKARSAA